MSKIRIREHRLDDVVSRLVEFNHSQNSDDGATYAYLLCGKRLVPWRRALVEPASLGNFLKRGRWRDRCVTLPFRADAIQVKNNLRVFGYGPRKNLTAKIALAGLFRGGTLSREVRVRQLLRKTTDLSFGVAPMVSYDPQGARWFVEEQIAANPIAEGVAEEFVADHALGFYRSTARTRMIGQRSVAGLPIAKFAAFLPDTGPLRSSERLASLHWPVALGHGDLSKGNMLRDAQGTLFLVDWEKAGVGPVAFDLRLLYARQPKQRDDILSLIGALGQGEKNIAPPELQMALALAAEAALLERDGSQIVQYLMHRDRLGLEQAGREVQDLIARSRKLAAALLPAA